MSSLGLSAAMPSARCLRALFGFFTILPAGAELDFSCAWALPYTVAPAVGGAAALIMSAVGPLPAYLTLLVLTGLNHLDGLADTADALMVRNRERARAVLEDPRRGTAGIFAVLASVLLAIAYSREPAQLAAAEVFSKSVTVILAAHSRAFKEGLGALFMRSVRGRWPLALPALALLAYFRPAATAAALATSLLLYYIAYRHLGGANGDVLGYLLETSRVSFIVLYNLAPGTASLLQMAQDAAR